MYLLRKRKDSGINKLQEIFDKIDEIGREMAPDGNYKLCITVSCPSFCQKYKRVDSNHSSSHRDILWVEP